MSNDGLLGKWFSKKNTKDEESLSDFIRGVEEDLSEYSTKMIRNIVELREITVKEIMVPRVDVVYLDVKSDIDDIIKLVDAKGRTRLPVYDGNLDNIIGILHAKDLLKYFNKGEKFELSKNLRTAYFVPESKFIGDLLVELREKRIHLAVVVDEYGGMSGIVCLEDIIEKIVGEIQDEFDNEADEVIEIGPNQYLVDSRISVEDLNERLDLSLPEDEVDTLGGLIYAFFGRIPIKNESIVHENIKYTINSISGRKLKRVKMEILNNADKAKDNDNDK